MKQTLRRFFVETLDELSLDRVISAKLRLRDGRLETDSESIELDRCARILTVAIGKAAHPMARNLARILEPRATSGIVVSSVEDEPPPGFRAFRGGHPYPDEHSFEAARAVEEMLSGLTERDLVVYLLSGGGSAICERPVSETITLKDSRRFFEVLVTCGADIVEMNTLRKHFSGIKGGRLAVRAFPARQFTLYVSDVPPQRPSSVASGPTMPDESTLEDCYEIADRLRLRERFPDSIRRMFEEHSIPETPKPGDREFRNSSWVSLLDNSHAVEAIRRRAEAEGWAVEVDLSVDDRPVAEAVDRLLERLESLRREHPGRTAAVVSGGELSSPVRGDGMGGRNQAFVLDCVAKIAGRGITVISAGTDGVDGNSPAAGAVADSSSLERALKSGLDPADYEARSDSYNFFERLADLVVTGPTGNNVRDVRLLVAE